MDKHILSTDFCLFSNLKVSLATRHQRIENVCLCFEINQYHIHPKLKVFIVTCLLVDLTETRNH